MSHAKHSMDDSISSAVDRVGETVKAGAQQVAHTGANMYQAAVDRSTAVGEQVDGYVRKNPWRAVGIAVGVGVAVGILLSRRR